MARYIRSRQMKKARRTSGNITLNSINWANVDTGLDLVLAHVEEGDQLMYGISGVQGNQAVSSHLDVVTVVSGSPVNSFAVWGPVTAAPGVQGIQAWFNDGVVGYREITGTTPPYTVVSGDLSAGTVTLRLRYSTVTASNKTLYAQPTNPLTVWAWNMGPLQG